MFKDFKSAIQKNFQQLAENNHILFYTNLDRDKVFETYLSGFEGEDWRQEHDCNSCKSFLRQFGGIVAIVNNKMVSIFDSIEIEGFTGAAKALSNYIHSLPITDVFYTESTKCGTDRNVDSQSKVTWQHLYLEVPKEYVINTSAVSIDTTRGAKRDNKAVLKRSIDELTIDATETILDLIAQDSLYRGSEFKNLLSDFLTIQKQYKKLPTEEKDNFCWLQSATANGALTRIRNSAIGTLLINLSENMELETAVGKFEQVVAPSNYKRPTALVTPRMLDDAKKTLEAEGLLESLERRYATEADLNTSDILFTNVELGRGDIFSELAKETTVNSKTLSKVEEIHIDKFLSDVLPNIKSVEVLLENNHLSNLVTLLTAKNENAPSLFKWNTPFSWNYTGGITDSLKDKVAALGGRVDGVFRFTHSWNHDGQNQSLMDLHVCMPGSDRKYQKDRQINVNYGKGRRIGWNARQDYASGGVQDVDFVKAPVKEVPVENITFPILSKMPEGDYLCRIHNWSARNPNRSGFEAEIEFGGNIYSYFYRDALVNHEWIDVATVTLKSGAFSIEHHLPENTSNKEKWNLTTNQFHAVDKIMLSPNYWRQEVGNKHYLFFLKDCKSDETPRGFFNEFLKQDLDKHRKTLELLGSRIKVEDSESQLSGVGFSSTKRDSVILKVQGKFSRLIKVLF